MPAASSDRAGNASLKAKDNKKTEKILAKEVILTFSKAEGGTSLSLNVC